ncbi:major facilitator superfamily domain-containing protein [Chiua virens]|nr:major facilitator superfamily domain-containing protein [Chiua virens]
MAGSLPFYSFSLPGVLANCLIPGSQFMPNWISDWVFLAGMLTGYLSGILPCIYLVNMYVVDICDPKDRTAALSRISGWGTLGTCISFFFGGSITMKTGNPLIVFYIAAALFAATFIYVVSVLPESFPKEKRVALSQMRQDSESVSGELSSVTLLSSFSLIFEPLKMLVPIRRLDGTRNWRLAWCGLHTLLFTTSFIYTAIGWLVIATSVHHLTPAQTGLFLSVVTVSGAITLTVILPLLVRLLRPYYIRGTAHSLLEEEDRSDTEEPGPETSDHLDVHLAFVSCVIAGVFYLFAAASTTYQTLILSAICIGFAYVHTPTVRSLAVGSVDPLKQGEALAAIEMVSGVGTVLSPIIMGSILTATINTTPLVLFYCQLGADASHLHFSFPLI